MEFVVEAGFPLLAPDPKKLKVDYGTNQPMVKLELNPPNEQINWDTFDQLCQTSVQDIEIVIENIEVTDLLLSK